MYFSVAQQPSHFELGISNTQSVVAWLFGLSGSGKLTLTNLLKERLKQKVPRTMILNGNSIPATISSDPEFTDEDGGEASHAPHETL